MKSDNPDWLIDKIEEKTGIKQRFIASEESVVDMAEYAVKKLIKKNVDINEIDLIIFVTQTPAYPLPTSACVLHERLGLKQNCSAFDINLGCSGYVYALAQASSLIETGLAKTGLIICSEMYSKYIDKNDRICRPIFSDAAAVTLIESSHNYHGVGPFELGTCGAGFRYLIVDKNENSNHGKLFMDGRKVFMFTMDTVPKCVRSLLLKAEMTLNDIDLFIFHQASKVVIDNIIRRLDIPKNKTFINYQNVGNTVSASVPIALKHAIDDGRIHDGSIIMLVGFGVGLSYGGCIVRWKDK